MDANAAARSRTTANGNTQQLFNRTPKLSIESWTSKSLLTVPEMAPPKAFLDACASFLESGQYSDLIIQCDHYQWPVHKIFLCTQSSFFAKACNGPFLEANNGIISLSNDHPVAVSAMLVYLYTDGYDANAGQHQYDQAIPPMMRNVLVYELAAKLDIQPLAKLASEKFCTRAKTDWATEDFADAISELYQNAPDSASQMRAAAVEEGSKHARDLLRETYGEHFRTLLKDVPTFATEFQLAAVDRQKGLVEGSPLYMCSSQGKGFTLHQAPIGQCPHCRAWIVASPTSSHFRVKQLY